MSSTPSLHAHAAWPALGCSPTAGQQRAHSVDRDVEVCAPLDEEQKVHEMFHVKECRLTNLTTKAATAVLLQDAIDNGLIADVFLAGVSVSFSVSLYQQTGTPDRPRRMLNAGQLFSQEWYPSKGPVFLFFRRIGNVAVMPQMPLATSLPPTPNSGAAPAAAAAAASSSSGVQTNALASSVARGTVSPLKSAVKNKKRRASRSPSSSSSASSASLAPLHDDLSSKSDSDTEMEPASPTTARKLFSSPSSPVSNSKTPHGKRPRLTTHSVSPSAAFVRIMRLQKHADLGEVLCIGSIGLALDEDHLLPERIAVGSRLRMGRREEYGVSLFEQNSVSAAGAARTPAPEAAPAAAAAASAISSPSGSMPAAVSELRCFPKAMFGPHRPIPDTPVVDWGAFAHSLVFGNRGPHITPVLQAEAHVLARDRIRVTMYLFRTQIIRGTDPAANHWAVLLNMRTPDMNARIARLMYQLVEDDSVAARALPLVQHAERSRRLRLRDRELSMEQLARLEGDVMEAATVELPHSLPPIQQCETSATRPGGGKVALVPHQRHGVAELAAQTNAPAPMVGASFSSVALPGQLRLFNIIDEANNTTLPLFHNFFSGYSIIASKQVLPLELIRHCMTLWTSPGGGKTLLALSLNRELRLADKHAGRRCLPTLWVTREPLVPQTAESMLDFMSPCRVAILLSTKNSHMDRGAISKHVERLMRRYNGQGSQISIISSLAELRNGDYELCIADWMSLRICASEDKMADGTPLEPADALLYNGMVTDEGQLLKTVGNRQQLVEVLRNLGAQARFSLAVTGTPLNRGRMDDFMFLFKSLRVPLFEDEAWLHRFILLPLSLDPLADAYGCRHALLSLTAHLALKHMDKDIPFRELDQHPVCAGVPTATESAINALMVNRGGVDLNSKQLAACHPGLWLYAKKAARLAELPLELFAPRDVAMESSTSLSPATTYPAASSSSAAAPFSSVFPATGKSAAKAVSKAAAKAAHSLAARAKANDLVAFLSDMSAIRKQASLSVRAEVQTVFSQLLDTYFQAADTASQSGRPRDTLQHYKEAHTVLQDMQQSLGDYELTQEQTIRWKAGSGAALKAIAANAASVQLGEDRIKQARSELEQYSRHLASQTKLNDACQGLSNILTDTERFRRPQEYSDPLAAALVRRSSKLYWMKSPYREAVQVLKQLKQDRVELGLPFNLTLADVERHVEMETSSNAMLSAGGSQGHLPDQLFLQAVTISKVAKVLRYVKQLNALVAAHAWTSVDEHDINTLRGTQPCHADIGGFWTPTQPFDDVDTIAAAVSAQPKECHFAPAPIAAAVPAAAPAAAATSSAAAAAAAAGPSAVPFLSRCCVCRLMAAKQALEDALLLPGRSLFSPTVTIGGHVFPFLFNTIIPSLRWKFGKLLKPTLLVYDKDDADNTVEHDLSVLSDYNLSLAVAAILAARARPPANGVIGFEPVVDTASDLKAFTDDLPSTGFSIKLDTPLASVSDADLGLLRRLYESYTRMFECEALRHQLESRIERTLQNLVAVREALIAHVRRMDLLFRAVKPVSISIASSAAAATASDSVANVAAAVPSQAAQPAAAAAASSSSSYAASSSDVSGKVLAASRELCVKLVQFWKQHALDLRAEESAMEHTHLIAPDAEVALAAAAGASAAASQVPFSSRKFMDIASALRRERAQWERQQTQHAVKQEPPGTAAPAAAAAAAPAVLSTATGFGRYRALVISNHRAVLPLLAYYLAQCGFSVHLPTGDVFADMHHFQYGCGKGFQVMIAHTADVGNGIDLPGLHCVCLADAFIERRKADQAALRARRLAAAHRAVLQRFLTLGTVEQVLSYGSLPRHLLQRLQRAIMDPSNLARTAAMYALPSVDRESVAAARPSSFLMIDSELGQVEAQQMEALAEQWRLPSSRRDAFLSNQTPMQRLLQWCAQEDLPVSLLFSPYIRAHCVASCFDTSRAEGAASASALSSSPSDASADASADASTSRLSSDELAALIQQEGLRTSGLQDEGLFASVERLLNEEQLMLPAAARSRVGTACDLSHAVLELLHSSRFKHLAQFVRNDTEASLEAALPAAGEAADWICVQLLAVHLGRDIVLVTDDAARRMPVHISPLHRQERVQATLKQPLHLAHWQRTHFAPLYNALPRALAAPMPAPPQAQRVEQMQVDNKG